MDHDQTEAPICPPVTEDNSKITYERCISFPVDVTCITPDDPILSGITATYLGRKKIHERIGQLFHSEQNPA